MISSHLPGEFADAIVPDRADSVTVDLLELSITAIEPSTTPPPSPMMLPGQKYSRELGGMRNGQG